MDLNEFQYKRLMQLMQERGVEPTADNIAASLEAIRALPPEDQSQVIRSLQSPDPLLRGVPELAQALLAIPQAGIGLLRRSPELFGGEALSPDTPILDIPDRASEWIDYKRDPQALETSEKMGSAPFTPAGAVQVVRAIKEDPGAAVDILGSVAGYLIPFTLASKLARLAGAAPRLAGLLSEAGVAAASSVAERQQQDDVGFVELVLQGATQAVKTAALSVLGRKYGEKWGGAQYEDVFTGAAADAAQSVRGAGRLQQFGASTLVNTLEESAEETLQTAIDNMFEDRPVTEGLMGSAVAGGLMGGALGGAAGIGPQTRGPAPDPAPDMFSPEAESVAAPILDETVTPAEPEAEPAAAPAEPVAAVEPEPPTAAPVTPDEVREAVTDYILSPLTEAAETAAAEAGVDLEAVETPTKFYDERMESEDVDLGADEADLAAPGDTAADAAFAGDPASALVGVKEEIAWRRAELNGMTDAELRHEMQTAKFMADAGHGPKLEDTPHGDVLNAWLAAGREGRKVRETAAGAKPEPDAPEEVAAAEAVEKGPKAPQPVTEPVTEPAAEPEPEKPPAPSLVKPEPEKKPEPEPVEPPPETERPAAEKGSPEEYREAAEHYRKLRTLEEGPAPGPAPQPEPAAAPAGPTGRARAPRSVKELGERLTGAAAAAETLPPSKARREARKRADAVAVKEKKAREERAENLKKPATIKSRIKSQPVGKDVAESIKYRTLAGDARASRAGETWEETQRREFGSTVEELAEQDEKQNKIDFDKRVKGEPIVESDDP